MQTPVEYARTHSRVEVIAFYDGAISALMALAESFEENGEEVGGLASRDAIETLKYAKVAALAYNSSVTGLGETEA